MTSRQSRGKSGCTGGHTCPKSATSECQLRALSGVVSLTPPRASAALSTADPTVLLAVLTAAAALVLAFTALSFASTAFAFVDFSLLLRLPELRSRLSEGMLRWAMGGCHYHYTKRRTMSNEFWSSRPCDEIAGKLDPLRDDRRGSRRKDRREERTKHVASAVASSLASHHSSFVSSPLTHLLEDHFGPALTATA